MYDELILKLRKDAKLIKISSKYNKFAERISQAADVIEKLSGERKKGKWCAYLTGKVHGIMEHFEACFMRMENGIGRSEHLRQ